MSSLQENSSLDGKQKTFFRCDSFDRLQSSAYYSLQLAGLLLSWDSLVQLLDAVISKCRSILQKAIVLLSLPAFTMCCAVVLFWIEAFTKYTGINVAFEKKIVTSANVEPEKTYILRVQKRKITHLATQKTDERATITEKLTTKTIPTAVTEPLKPIKEIDLNNHPRLTLPVPQLVKTDSVSDFGSNTSISSRQNLGLAVIVYGSATLVYIQLMLLAVFLQSASTPPGLVFLVSSLGFIGYVVFKICFVKAKAKEEITQSPPVTRKLSSSSDDGLKKHTGSHARLGRSITRRFLYFHNKTLSKIKLL